MSKSKVIIFKTITVIASVFIVLFGISYFPIQYPKYIILQRPLSYYQSTITRGLIYILLGVLCIIKLFVKNKIITKTFATITGTVSVADIIVSIINLLPLRTVGSYYTRLLFENDPYLFTPYIFNFIFSVLIVMATVNTFKPFISKKTAVIIAVLLSLIGLLISCMGTKAPSVFSLEYILNDLITEKLFYISLFPTMYVALKNVEFFTFSNQQKL